jgi:Bax protein
MACLQCCLKLIPLWAVLISLSLWWWALPPAPVAVPEQPMSWAHQSIVIDEEDADVAGLSVTLVLPPDFSAIGLTDERKQAFIHWLLPLILHENAEIAAQRREAVHLYGVWQKKRLSLAQKEWLTNVAMNYGVQVDEGFNLSFWQNLLHRLDVLPPSLVLTQAAIETGWGTSRIAKEANNYFGMMCFKKGCGVAAKGMNGEFRRYAKAQDSVESYMRLLNISGIYRAARMERMKNRLLGEEPSGMQMAKTLLSYSELGSRYVKFMIQIMHDNELTVYDGVTVMPADVVSP